MNIGFFTDTYLPQLSGVATSIDILKQKLEENGHNVYIFTTTDPNATCEKNVFRCESIPFLFFKERRIAVTFFAPIVKKVRALKIDIIHTHTEFSMGMLGAIAAKVLNLPMVHTYHTWYAKYLHYLWDGKLITEDTVRVLSKLFCERADTVIVPSETIRQVLFGYDVTKPIQIVATGVPLPESVDIQLINKLRMDLALDDKDFVLLSVNRLAEEKNLLTLLEKMTMLRHELPNVKLILVGDGPQRAELEQYVRTHDLTAVVRFTGMVNHQDINTYYQLADLYVNLSLSETQGLTYIEAITNNLPVVAMESDYLESLEKISSFGRLLNDPNDFAKTVTEIYRSQDTLQVNLQKLIQEVSADTFYERIYGIYQREITYNQFHIRWPIIPEGKYHMKRTFDHLRRPLPFKTKNLIGKSNKNKH